MPESYTAKRIACLQPSATVTLDAIGVLDRVVACTRYCADVVPAVADGSRVLLADSWTANADQIIAARPDLVIASVPYQEKAVVEIMKSGIRFLGLAPKCLADIYTDIATIAGVVGRSTAGADVISSMQARIADVRRQTQSRRRLRVFCEEWGKPLITSQQWVAELVDAAGGEFLGEPGCKVLQADVPRLDPEVIIASWCGAGDRVPLEKIVDARSWHEMAAARSRRVFCIRDEYLNTPAVTLLNGLAALAYAIHPDLFPQAKGIRQITGTPVLNSENQTH